MVYTYSLLSYDSSVLSLQSFPQRQGRANEKPMVI